MKTFNFDNSVENEEQQELQEAEWEQITAAHAKTAEHSNAESEPGTERIYCKIAEKRRERTGITAARYAMGAVLLGGMAGIVARSGIVWLGWTIGICAGICALIAAYGAGKYREM